MKKRVVREVKSEENRLLSGLFGIALFVAVVASILLVAFYSPRNQTLTGEVISGGSTGITFSISGSHSIRIGATTSGLPLGVSTLYLNNARTQYVGVGEDSNTQLVTSAGTEIVLNRQNGERRFVGSWQNGSRFESYYFEYKTIGSDASTNITTIRNLNTLQEYDIRVGDDHDIGGIKLILNSANKNTEVINLTIGSSVGSGEVYFNRLYDASGNYVVLPLKSQLPLSEYIFSVYNKDGVLIQKHNASIVALQLAINPVCYDSDNGNVSIQGFASKGQMYVNDVCINNDLLNESICEGASGVVALGIVFVVEVSGGNIGYAIANCSQISQYGGRCVEGACVANGPPSNPSCTSNWVAYNTTCQDNNFVTYYMDSNSCGTTSGRPSNVTVFCGLSPNGLLGTRENIGVHGVSVDLRVNNVTVNYSRNYTGAVRKVLIFDRSSNESIFDFNWNFSRILDLSTIFVERQHGSSASKGYVVVNGLELNKTVYVDKLNDLSTKVCIKDVNDTSVSRISRLCDRVDEILLDCPGDDEGYSCDIDGYSFIVSGLRHSAVMEFVEADAGVTCVPDWQCEGWGVCINNITNTRSRVCSDINYCDDLTGKPALSENCYESTSNLTGVYTPFVKCVWECTSWDPLACPADTKMQSRTCTEKNGCGSLGGKPLESKTCIPGKSDTVFYILIVLIFLAILVIIGVIAYVLIHKKPLVTESHVNPSASPVQPGQKPFQPGQGPFQPGQPGTGAGYGPGYKPF